VKTARWWKDFYARERETLGRHGLEARLGSAPPVTLPPHGALVFPHALLAACGEQVAAAALAVVRSGREEVVALGVLHGGREKDARLVEAAKGGDHEALVAMRRVHGPGTQGDEGHWREEFSLDGFAALLELAGKHLHHPPPHLVARYPFLVGQDPESLRGLDELQRRLEAGAALVATADLVHHGAGHGTPRAARHSRGDPRTLALARASCDRSFELLAHGDLEGFAAHCDAEKSDFRDAGPVMALLLQAHGWITHRVKALTLVDYADVLGTEQPTWVAAALTELNVTQA
jgi:predicted class III extradiol MEMO1 family dioxygenase